MTILPIITAPDPRLKQLSEPVEKVDDELRRLMDDMLETMYAAPGIGLAAVQVGVAKRVLVVDVTPDRENGEGKDGEDRKPICMANPEIISFGDDLTVLEEGCLSLPDQFAEVERPGNIRLRYIDYQGELREQEMSGLLATCVQHEIDHLDGILFVDHLSGLKRNIILRRLAKEKRTAAG